MKILHADDHPTFRTGLRYVLEDLSDEIEILEARDIKEALTVLAQQHGIDLIILDLSMPGMEGFQGYHDIKQRATCPIVIISASEQYQDVRQARDAGVQGYFAKSATRDTLLQGLHTVLSGKDYFPQHLLSSTANTPQVLSQRQLEVLQLLGKGCSNKEVANQLGITEATTKTHVRAILRALDVRTRMQAVMKGQALKLF